MEFINQFKEIMYFGNSVYDYVIALGIFIASLLVLKFVQVVIIARLKKMAKKTTTDLDDTVISIFTGIKPPFYFLIALYVSITYLTFSGWAEKIFYIFLIFIVVYEIIRAFEKVVDYGLSKYLNKSDEGVKTKVQNKAMINAVKLTAKIVLWSIGLLVILSNLGVNVTSLIASLGVGGIAVALALQNVLGDIFSSFSIYIDKPFQIGDFIMIGTDAGTVERIGLKSTRIRTLRGDELVVSNKELTTARVQNLKKMEKRTYSFSVNIVYETQPEKLEKISQIVKNIVTEVEHVEFLRCHFSDFGDSGLTYDIAYQVDSPDYDLYMDIKQSINFGILKAFKTEGIEFAYPTQVIYTKKA